MPESSAANDAQLIESARQGDFEAFTELYQRYLPRVLGRVRCSVPATDVDDVTQEIFVAVLHSLPRFRGEARFSTWLRTLVNRKIADYYRLRNRLGLQHATELEEAGEHAPGVPDGHAASDDRIVLSRAMRALPEQYREILILRFAEDMPFEQIARARHRSLDATKSLFRRAVAALRKQMSTDNVEAD